MKHYLDRSLRPLVIEEQDYSSVGTENILMEILEGGAGVITETFKFFHSVVTLNLNSYFDNKMHTNLNKDIFKLSRRIDKLTKVSFLEVKDRSVVVAPGFSDRIDLIEGYVKLVIADTIKDSDKALKIFNKEIGLFISDEDYRKKEVFVDTFYKQIEKKQFEIDGQIQKFVTASDETLTSVMRLIGNHNGFKSVVSDTVNVFNMIDEKHLKKYLADVRNTNNRIDTALSIIRTSSDISDEAIDNLNAVVTSLANQITLLGKLFSIHFQIAQIALGVEKAYLEKE